MRYFLGNTEFVNKFLFLLTKKDVLYEWVRDIYEYRFTIEIDYLKVKLSHLVASLIKFIFKFLSFFKPLIINSR